MAATKDWLPTTRDGQIAMAKEWINYAGSQAEAWNIPAAVVTELRTFMLKAQAALDTAKNETTRTPLNQGSPDRGCSRKKAA